MEIHERNNFLTQQLIDGINPTNPGKNNSNVYKEFLLEGSTGIEIMRDTVRELSQMFVQKIELVKLSV
jgi:hypothetical protein